MNIIIPDSWLRVYLKTKATPSKIAECLSLCSQQVQKLNQIKNDWIYEIEITTNRPDCLSVYGIARELAAILPRFGIKASLKPIKEADTEISGTKKSLSLEVKINNSSLCPRFTAIIFDKVVYKPSPKIVCERLKKSGIRALNNIVDISNYLMLELGQPMHTFDYDKVKSAKMILRESAGGEKLTTLDGQTRVLPEGTIVIEDGEGRIIDLCGIMGGENSAVDENTKRVLLFVQTYNPMKIRRVCQALGFQTEAAQRFEKGVDPEGVIPTIKKAITMFEKNCQARVASNLIDIYPNPLKSKIISLSQEKLDQIMGIHLNLSEANKILESLGFKTQLDARRSMLNAIVPYWRQDDIDIPEDLIEEIARIYGYFNLPLRLPEAQVPQTKPNPSFAFEEKIKDALKFWGFTEVVNYSMISQVFLDKIGFESKNCLKIANPLNKDLIFMRPSLIPSVLMSVNKNQVINKKINIFEMANIYLPKKPTQLPNEILKLTGASNENDFSKIKGIIESILSELKIERVVFQPYVLKKTDYSQIFHPLRTAEILVNDNPVGIVGEINYEILKRFNLKNQILIFDLEFSKIINFVSNVKKYHPQSKYPAIVEDLAFIVPPKTYVGRIIRLIKECNSTIQSVELLDSFKDIRTFRLTYQSNTRNLTDAGVMKIRKNIIELLAKKYQVKLKTISEN